MNFHLGYQIYEEINKAHKSAIAVNSALLMLLVPMYGKKKFVLKCLNAGIEFLFIFQMKRVKECFSGETAIREHISSYKDCHSYIINDFFKLLLCFRIGAPNLLHVVLFLHFRDSFCTMFLKNYGKSLWPFNPPLVFHLLLGINKCMLPVISFLCNISSVMGFLFTVLIRLANS